MGLETPGKQEPLNLFKLVENPTSLFVRHIYTRPNIMGLAIAGQ